MQRSIFHLPLGVRGSRFKKRLRNLTSVLTTVIIVGLSLERVCIKVSFNQSVLFRINKATVPACKELNVQIFLRFIFILQLARVLEKDHGAILSVLCEPLP